MIEQVGIYRIGQECAEICGSGARIGVLAPKSAGDAFLIRQARYNTGRVMIAYEMAAALAGGAA